MKRWVGSVAAAALLMGTLAGCGSTTATSKASSPVNAPPLSSIMIIYPGAPMNPFNVDGLPKVGLDTMPLAFFKQTPDPGNPSAYWPALASHWTINAAGSVLTVWLRNAQWSNGTPITAQDVKTSWAIQFALGVAQGFYLGQVNVVGPREVQFKEVPGSHYNMFMDSILTQVIVPSAEYSHLLPKDVWTLIAQAQYAGTNSALKKKAASASTQLTKLGTTVTAYAPPKDVSSGPFVLQGVNPGEAVFVKNPRFYGASGIHVQQVVLRNNTGGPSDWNYMISGINQATGGIPLNILNKAKKTPGNVFYRVHVYGLAGIAFNEHVYPYNLVAVRRALAYLIDRKSIQHVANPVSGVPADFVDGMIDSETKSALPSNVLASLKSYAYSPSKATSILLAAGFKKSGGQWIMPNGKPWTATLYAPSGYPAWVSSVQVISQEMKSFGIPAKFDAVQLAEYFSEQTAGKFAISMAFGQKGPEPYYTWSPYYGAADGYKAVGNTLVREPASSPTSGNWIDFPTTVNVAGFGRVSPGVLTYQLSQSLSPAVIRRNTTELAALTNQYVPFIPLWDNVQTGFINDKTYTDFPLKNAGVMLGAYNYFPPVGVWMILGYIRPR